MTHRLYYDDPYSTGFDASVVRVESRGDHQAVWLDRSLFYPTTGGQPFDTGRLETAAVVDCLDEDGDVVHLVAGGAFAAGAPVHGEIDWPRRFDHMQQHTGQHMLSAALVRIVNAPTVSFHLGAELSTIDVSREVTAEEIAAAEDEANRVVWQDRAVAVRYADADDAADLGLRKPSTRRGLVRLVDIADFDLSACGGTHVARTGAVGVIAVSAWERCKGGTRIEFACGGRALRRHRLLRDVVASSVRRLSVLPGELPGAVERLQHEQREQRRLFVAQEEELARYRAVELAQRAERIGSALVVVASCAGDPAALRSLASAVASEPGRIVVLVSPAAPASLIAMRAPDALLACHDLVRAMCSRFGGRGGGKPDLAQGGGLNGTIDDMLAEARRLVVQALG